MRHKITIGAALFLAMLLLSVVQTRPVNAQESMPAFGVEITDYPETIQPGQSYSLTIRVTRPAGVVLPTWQTGESPPKWEVRTYFYDGLNCYSSGEWSEIGGTTLYTGWWDYRVQGDSWTATMDDTRDFTITNKIVTSPRPADDITNGMTELSADGEIKLRARLRLRWGDPLEFENDNIIITYNNQTFTGVYENKSDATTEKYKVGSLYIEKSEGGYWQIDYDATQSGIKVSIGGSSLTLIAIVGVVVLVALVAVIVVITRKRRGGEEIPSYEGPQVPAAPSPFPTATLPQPQPTAPPAQPTYAPPTAPATAPPPQPTYAPPAAPRAQPTYAPPSPPPAQPTYAPPTAPPVQPTYAPPTVPPAQPTYAPPTAQPAAPPATPEKPPEKKKKSDDVDF
jgi:hypothetical protein